LFPEGLTESTTLLLIDLTPGPNNGRRGGFAEERSILSAFAAGLPEGEIVGVYGFHDELELIVPFTADRTAVREGIEGMSLKGSNTLIGTNISEALDVLSGQDASLFRNLIVVTDGEDEGGSVSATDLGQRAIDAGVSLSAIGSYWRAIGASEIGQGKAYLTELTRAGLGSVVHAELRRGADARAEVEAFGADLRAAASASGLIVATQAEGQADITVTLKEPVPGEAGTFRDQPVTLRFVPEGFVAGEDDGSSEGEGEGGEGTEEDEITEDGEGTTSDGEEGTAETQMLFGYPAYYTYIAAGALAAIFALILFLVLRRKSDPEAVLKDDLGDLGDLDDDIDIDGPIVAPATTGTPTTAQHNTMVATPVAYLHVENSGKRFAISKERITIGRSSSNRVVIDDSSVSRVHAELHPNRDGGFSITDMQSLNGTFLNRERIKSSRAVKPGDVLTFGEVKTKLVLP
ncbi:MAG: FHA domain-containing protein, partial [Pseudomonadota bacterium]